MDYYEIPSISEIVPGLLIGNAMCTFDLSTLQSNHINAVVSLVNAPLNLWKRTKFTNSVTIGRHLWIECVDSSTFDMLVHLDRICDFIDQMLLSDQQSLPQTSSQPGSSESEPFQQVPEIDSDMKTISKPPGVVLVHCDLGISRSATAVIAYLMRMQHRTRDDVLAELRAKHKRTKPSANFTDQLEVWEQVGYQIWEDEAKTIPKKEYAAYRERRAAALQAKGLTGNEPMRLLEL
jgi:Dual specificity phosphatase, catalytic domain